MLKIWKWIETHPIIANPILVALYGTISFLTLEGTQLGDINTWVKAGSILVLSLLSALKNILQSYQTKKVV
jgi:hypothetical protein